jgi:hypothetical protein
MEERQMKNPIQVTDAWAGDVVGRYMVPRDKIPTDYKDKEFFLGLQSRWFFCGLSKNELPAVREGVSEAEALRHLMLIQSSFDPSHEHKRDCVAWLMSLWFQGPESVKPPEEVKPVVKKPLSKGRQKRRRS